MMMAEYIEREAAKAAIRVKFKTIEERAEINEVLNAIPAADVRPVGEWNWTVEGDEDYEQFWVCSRCGAKMYFATNYCPYCGAKMEVSEDA